MRICFHTYLCFEVPTWVVYITRTLIDTRFDAVLYIYIDCNIIKSVKISFSEKIFLQTSNRDFNMLKDYLSNLFTHRTPHWTISMNVTTTEAAIPFSSAIESLLCSPPWRPFHLVHRIKFPRQFLLEIFVVEVFCELKLVLISYSSLSWMVLTTEQM